MSTSATSYALTRLKEKTLFGHPKGVYYLAFTEAWERFSYYGMTALVVLFMVDQLLLPGHIERVAGFGQMRGALETLFGPLSTQALASQIFGFYTGFVYFTPLLGGYVADRWIGQRTAVVIGALLMSGGHIAMAFDQTFLVALLLLVIGSGFLKGNISAQVGTLYTPNDEARRSRGFVIFSTGINVGAVVGPLVCGLIAAMYGWHAGFGIAAACMLVGMATYLYGYRYLPPRVERRSRVNTRLTPADWRIVVALVAVIAITIFQSVCYYQIGDALPIWIQDHVNLKVSAFAIPIAWYQSIDSFVSILFVPAIFWVWRYQASRGREPSDLRKIGIGAWIATASTLILMLAIMLSDGKPISAWWPFFYCVGHGIGFLYYWPTLLALVSQAAPAPVNATLMGIVFTSMFVANILIGWLGGLYEKMAPLQFWTLHALIAAAGGLLIMVFGHRLSKMLRSD